jgi:predicted O-methyltransferase YrrM
MSFTLTGLINRLRGSANRNGYPPGHYYSPVPDLRDVRARATDLFQKDVDTIAGVDLRKEAQVALFREFAQRWQEFDWTEQPSQDRRYHTANSMFQRGSGFVLFAFLRHFQPKRIIEIGSGFSSALMLDTDDRFSGGNVSFTFIEPYPERLHKLLRPSDRARCRIHEQPLQSVPLTVFDSLGAGDLLFVDSSHVTKVGSDVNRIFFDILPALPTGTLVHFHDVFYPFEYPQDWIENGKHWNEAYLLRAFLQYNGAFELLLFNDYIAQLLKTDLTDQFPAIPRSLGSSVWLRKR